MGDVLTSYTKAFSHVANLVTSGAVLAATVDWDACAAGFERLDDLNSTTDIFDATDDDAIRNDGVPASVWTNETLSRGEVVGC